MILLSIQLSAFSSNHLAPTLSFPLIIQPSPFYCSFCSTCAFLSFFVLFRFVSFCFCFLLLLFFGGFFAFLLHLLFSLSLLLIIGIFYCINYNSLLLYLITTHFVSHLSLASIVLIISTLIIGIFCCLNYTSLLLHLFTTHLVIDFIITM